MQKEKNFVERAQAVVDKYLSLQEAFSKNDQAKRKNVDVCAFALGALFQMHFGVFELFMERVHFDPMAQMSNTNALQSMVSLRFLLPYLEKGFDDNEWIYRVHEYCRNRVMSGNLVDSSAINPMDHLFGVYTYKAYCEIVKTINDVSRRYEE